ncbi:MAG: ABC transporter substrate-binding protein [Deltaproteobacteria bacterium]|nr:ABC transporter substrate-binding protein [Deltaproteobacteria bacterium]MBI3063463.1 ABC transporter substrate-binding protein [Deltaproteobacteria bacterium]
MKNLLYLFVVIAVVVVGAMAQAQQLAKVAGIGFQSAASPAAVSPRAEGFRQGLRELGYVEGKNIVIEWRYAEGKLDRLDEFAAEFVRLKVNVIVTAAPSSTRAAKNATSTMPIVMAWDSDPVANGFIASLARPGGNVTGLSSLGPEITGKQLELLKETIPRLSTVAVLRSWNPAVAQVLRDAEPAARAFKVHLQHLEVGSLKDIEMAFREARKGRADAVLVLASPIIESQRTQVADLAIKNRLPTMFWASEHVEVGGLMSYGANVVDMYRRAAVFVDKILKGTKPTDLPVEQPMRFEFIVNLKTANQIGLTIQPNVLVRANRVIR